MSPSSEVAISSKVSPASSPVQVSESSLGRTFGFFGRQLDRLIGFVTMIVLLAAISAVPVLNLLSLGFLLEASSRVSATGRFRDGFIGLIYFARVGKVALGAWLWFLPVRLVHSFWRDAELIQAGSDEASKLRGFLAFLIVVISLHLLAALLRVGKFRHLLIPAPFQWIRWMSGKQSFRLPKRIGSSALHLGRRLIQLGSLGFFGFLGAAIWLLIPLAVLFLSSSADQQGIALLGSFFGGMLLGFVALLIPFLQTRYSSTHHFQDFFDVSEVRKLFNRAPLAFCLALSATLLFALPLYLLKIELTPREVSWLPNLIFVLFIFPARLLLGWALSRARKSETPRKRPLRWIASITALPVVAAYVFIVWLSQYVSWHGAYSLLEQHTFLVPAPIFGL